MLQGCSASRQAENRKDSGVKLAELDIAMPAEGPEQSEAFGENKNKQFTLTGALSSIKGDPAFALDFELLHCRCVDPSADVDTQFQVVSKRTVVMRPRSEDWSVAGESYQILFDDEGHFCAIGVTTEAKRIDETSPGKATRPAEVSSLADNLRRVSPIACSHAWILKTSEDSEGLLEPESLLRQKAAEHFRERRTVDASLGGLRPVQLSHRGVEALPPACEQSIDLQPIFLEKVVQASEAPSGDQSQIKSVHNSASEPGPHVVALVSCHRGSGEDMRALRNYLSAGSPGIVCTIFSAALDDTLDLPRAGVRLAEELSKCIEDNDASTVSFIAQGTGGLIVRAALPWMRSYATKLHTFLSIATPHLGLRPAVLRGSLAWRLGLARAWARGAPSRSLEQLALADARFPQEGFLYRLSGDSSFQHFRDVVLVDLSSADAVVPAYSSVLSTPPTDGSADAASGASASLESSDRWERLTRTSKLWLKILAKVLALVGLVLPWLLPDVPWLQLLSPWNWSTRTLRILRLAILGLVLLGVKGWSMLKVKREGARLKARLEASGEGSGSSAAGDASKQGLQVELDMAQRFLQRCQGSRLTTVRVLLGAGAAASVLRPSLLGHLSGGAAHSAALRSRPLARALAARYGQLLAGRGGD
eukprot:TRINITY_DN20604_c0_g6_i1.p1 TRINITY_DN20604_c0_g6~~TRINITY_DN20604_c0_g6_i1.p1  ORF type:complete len:749 (-),score=154.71 TRINITY_DN20604_c0_g6_i1:257-2200(-)